MTPRQRTQSAVGRQAASPGLRGREAEPLPSTGGAFQLQDEQQPVDDDQRLAPQHRGLRRGVPRLLQHASQKRLHRPPRLGSQRFRHIGLMQPRGVENPLHRRHAARRGQRREETIRFRHPRLGCPPRDRHGDIPVRPGGIAQQQTQFLAVGDQTGAFPPRAQHPPRPPRRTDPRRRAVAHGRVEIGPGPQGPGAQRHAIGGTQHMAAILRALAGRDRLPLPHGVIAQGGGQRMHDMAQHAGRSARGGEVPQPPPHHPPARLRFRRIQPQPRQHPRQCLPHEPWAQQGSGAEMISVHRLAPASAAQADAARTGRA